MGRQQRERGRRGAKSKERRGTLVEIALKKSLPRKLKPTLMPVVPTDMTTTPASISQASFFFSDSVQKGLATFKKGGMSFSWEPFRMFAAAETSARVPAWKLDFRTWRNQWEAPAPRQRRNTRVCVLVLQTSVVWAHKGAAACSATSEPATRRCQPAVLSCTSQHMRSHPQEAVDEDAWLNLRACDVRGEPTGAYERWCISYVHLLSTDDHAPRRARRAVVILKATWAVCRSHVQMPGVESAPVRAPSFSGSAKVTTGLCLKPRPRFWALDESGDETRARRPFAARLLACTGRRAPLPLCRGPDLLNATGWLNTPNIVLALISPGFSPPSQNTIIEVCQGLGSHTAGERANARAGRNWVFVGVYFSSTQKLGSAMRTHSQAMPAGLVSVGVHAAVPARRGPCASGRRKASSGSVQAQRRRVHASAEGDKPASGLPEDRFLSEAEYKALLRGIESETQVTRASLAVTSNDVMGVTSRDTLAQKEV